jgi:Mrp family chromosome partitioning ATPase
MSRILEALRRIEETVRAEVSVPPAADAGGPRAEEPSLPREEDGDVGVFVPPEPVAEVAMPPAPPPETQIVYSLEAARLQRDDGRADPEPDPRFERLADLVVRGVPPGGHAVLMLTSPGTGEGKTRVTAALAEAIAAQTTGEVLAVEGDSNAPRLAALLRSGDGDASNGCSGLGGVLAGKAAWQGSVRRTPCKRLDILPGAKHAGQGAAISAADLGELVEELRCNYQWVLLDAPSTACPETMSLARLCDGVFVVVELGRTGRRAAQQAVELLREGGVNVLGCVAIGA